MSESQEIARAYVTIIPSLEGAQGEISKELVPAAESAAEEAGEKGGSKFSSKFGSSLGSVAKGIGKTLVAGLTAMTTAAVAGTTALTKQVSELAAYGDEIDKTSQKLGFSAEGFQEWDAVLQHSGSSISSIQPALKNLQQQVNKNSDAFKKLGLSADDLSGLSNEEVFSKTIEGLQNITDESERSALAQELLGKGAKELQPLLNTSAKDTEEMKNRVHELGGVLNDEAVKNAAAFQDSLQDMKTAMSGVKNNIISQLMPSFTTLMNGFTSLIIGEEGAKDAIKSGLKDLLNNASNIISQISDIISDLMPEIISILTESLPIFLQLGGKIIIELINGIVQFIPQIVSILPVLLDAIISMLDEILDVIIGVLPDVIIAIVDVFPELIPILVNAAIEIVQVLFENIDKIIPPLLETIWNVILTILGSLWSDFIGPALSKVGDFFKNIWDSITKIFEKAAEWFDKNVITPIINFFKGLLDSVVGFFTSLWDGIKNIWSSVSNWFKDNVTGPISSKFSDLWDGTKKAASNAWDGLKNAWNNAGSWINNNVTTPISNKFSNLWDGTKKAASNAWDGLKNAWNNAGSWIDKNVTSPIVNFYANAWNKITEGVTNLWDGVKKKFQDALDFLKNLFNFNWELPKIKMPHFSISGSFSLTPPSIPHISVEWYKKAMDEPMILDSATIFGIDNNGKLLGAGESGSETIVGTEKLLELIKEATGRPIDTDYVDLFDYNKNNNQIIFNIYGAEGQDEEIIADKVLDKLQFMINKEEAIYA